MRLNTAIRTINELIPDPHIHGSRSQNSLLPFIGSLFGTATKEDINTLAKHMNRLTKLAVGKLRHCLNIHTFPLLIKG